MPFDAPHLVACSFSFLGAVALAEILADSISLTRIDIRENHIQIAGLMAISLALKVNRSLVRIDLDKELRKEPVSILYNFLAHVAHK